ncbi:MAG TPA: hypothetical protein PLA68_08530 [Panacibacter sp.]|nr:hypothetical protein [Panacibacter sp.]
MKKISMSLTVLLFVAQSFCQTNVSELSKKMYMEKSRSQKTAAWILLGSGAAVTITGVIITASASNANDFITLYDRTSSGVILTGVGAAAIITSIPFFISAGHNARKAAAISLSNQKILLPQQNAFVIKSQPAVTLKINF